MGLVWIESISITLYKYWHSHIEMKASLNLKYGRFSKILSET
jgi:hypothetical protein